MLYQRRQTHEMWMSIIRDLLALCEDLLSKLDALENEIQQLKLQLQDRGQGYDTVC